MAVGAGPRISQARLLEPLHPRRWHASPRTLALGWAAAAGYEGLYAATTSYQHRTKSSPRPGIHTRLRVADRDRTSSLCRSLDQKRLVGRFVQVWRHTSCSQTSVGAAQELSNGPEFGEG